MRRQERNVGFTPGTVEPRVVNPLPVTGTDLQQLSFEFNSNAIRY